MNNILAQAIIPVTKPFGVTTNFGGVLSWLIRSVFLVGGIFVIYHLLMGAIDWISSGGDKEKVEKARKRITTALIGLIILFLTIALVALVESIFNIGLGITRNIYIPRFGTAVSN